MTKSLSGLEYDITVEKRLPFALFDIQQLRSQLKICDGDCSDELNLRRSLLSASSMIERYTGYALGPRVIVQSQGNWPNDAQTGSPNPSSLVRQPARASIMDIPIDCAPVWTSAEMMEWLELVDKAGSQSEKLFRDCVDLELPGGKSVQISYQDTANQWQTLTEDTCFRLDHRRRPPRLRLNDCCSWPCIKCNSEIVIRMICGFPDVCAIENYKPELLDAIVLATTDFYDGIPADEILKRNLPLWEMIAFR